MNEEIWENESKKPWALNLLMAAKGLGFSCHVMHCWMQHGGLVAFGIQQVNVVSGLSGFSSVM